MHSPSLVAGFSIDRSWWHVGKFWISATFPNTSVVDKLKQCHHHFMKCFRLALFPMNCVFTVTLKSHTANIASFEWNCTKLIAHLLTMCYSHDSNTNAIVLHVNLVAVLMWCDGTYLRALSYCQYSANYNTIDAVVNHMPLQITITI